eukprot:3931313-Rhodomonas_salina.1
MRNSFLRLRISSLPFLAPPRKTQAATQEEIDEAFDAAKAAQKLWAKTPLSSPIPLRSRPPLPSIAGLSFPLPPSLAQTDGSTDLLSHPQLCQPSHFHPTFSDPAHPALAACASITPHIIAANTDSARGPRWKRAELLKKAAEVMRTQVLADAR